MVITGALQLYRNNRANVLLKISGILRVKIESKVEIYTPQSSIQTVITHFPNFTEIHKIICILESEKKRSTERKQRNMAKTYKLHVCCPRLDWNPGS